MNPINEAEMLLALKEFVKGTGSQKRAAQIIGISPAYLSDILRGNREVPSQIGNLLGYQKITKWERLP